MRHFTNRDYPGPILYGSPILSVHDMNRGRKAAGPARPGQAKNRTKWFSTASGASSAR